MGGSDFCGGDFNEWNERSLPMTQDCHGVWQLAIDLSVGRSYVFRYLVDGRWLTD